MFRKKDKPTKKYKLTLICILCLCILTLFFYFKYSYKIKIIFPSLFDFSSDFISEETLINEVKSVNKLIPLEVELSETLLIDQSFGDLDIFKKTKDITFFANCSYSLDLSTLSSKDIRIDNKTKQIDISVPTLEIFSINIDESKTKYSDPTLGLLRFGDIELSSEEYGTLRSKLYDTFKNKMNDSSLLNKALANAANSLEAIISDLTGEIYSITVNIKKVG